VLDKEETLIDFKTKTITFCNSNEIVLFSIYYLPSTVSKLHEIFKIPTEHAIIVWVNVSLDTTGNNQK
jgi:hypothetical protein